LDVWIGYEEFIQIVRRGGYSGPIFESKNKLVTTCGALTVIASKPKPDRVYHRTANFRVYTLLRCGYCQISTDREELIDDEESAKMIAELTQDLSPELKKKVIAEIKKVEA